MLDYASALGCRDISQVPRRSFCGHVAEDSVYAAPAGGSLIDVVDFESRGATHLSFNAAVLRILAAAYPGRQVRFHADVTHIEWLQNDMGGLPDTVFAHPLPESAFAVRHTRWRPLRSTGALAFLRAANLAANTLVLGAHGWFVAEIARDVALQRKSCFDIVFHGTIAALGTRRAWPIRVLRGNYLESVFGLAYPPTVRFVLLERAIERALRALVRPSTKTATLEHPVATFGPTFPTRRPASRLRIAFIGGATRAKGFATFARAAARGNHNVEFHCVGQAPPWYDRSTDRLFTTAPQAVPLRQAQFDTLLSSMDLVCLPLDPVYYSWTPSGTLVDCFRFGLPVVTLRNAVVSDLETRYGRFGYVFDTHEAMVEFLATAQPTALEGERRDFQGTLRCIATDRSVETLAHRFRLNDGR